MSALAAVSRLFADLDAEDIEYLHWKSNQHLGPALEGDTDLDLLVRPGQLNHLRSTLRRHHFVEMAIPAHQYFPGRVGYLGFDPETGGLAHLDVHTELVLGEQLVKNHRLPIEDWLFTESDRIDGVRVPQVEKEFVVFYIRVMMKTTNRQRARSAFRRVDPLPGNIRDEVDWFAERVDRDALVAATDSAGIGLDPAEVTGFLDRAVAGKLSARYLHRRKRSLLRRFRRYEWDSRVKVIYKKSSRRLRSSRPARRVGLGFSSKRLVGAAPVVAAVGADGSGKTRLTRDLETWLRWKLAVTHLYFGQPKTGLGFRSLNKLSSILRRPRGWVRALTAPLAAVADRIRWQMLARSRRRLASDARRRAADGEVVIAERYPVKDFHTMDQPMDGPRLQRGRSRGAARRELAQYEAIPQPDLLLVLDAGLEELRGRKIDLTVEEHRAKVEAVKALAPAAGRVFIDASLPYEQVLLRAKAAVWEAIDAQG